MKPQIKWAEFIFPSTLLLAPITKELLEPIRMKERLDRLELGLQEALVNAAKHGNSLDSTKKLRVRRIITPNWYIWQIQDQGPGIPEEKRLCDLPSKIESENGRGLFLIHQCFDDVRWSQRGNRIQLGFRRVSGPC